MPSAASLPSKAQPAAGGDADPPTRQRILDAATALYAEHGFDNVSLRQITQRAAVNLAAVNYHFGGKEQLTAEVVSARLNPINRQRLELLSAAEDLADGGPVSLRAIMRAFLGPIFSFVQADEDSNRIHLKLMGRCMSHQDLPLTETALPLFREISQRYPAAIKRTLPELPVEVIQWRLLFSVGAVANALLKGDLLHRLTDGHSRRLGADMVMQEAVEFCTSGLRAPWQPL